jgi:PD-(D/E)XK nuclease superfamily
MKFQYEFHKFPKLESTTVDGKRYYTTPSGGKYPSVTTVLSERLPKDGLLEWRKRVGNEEANKISAQAARRGSKVHSLLEKYLRSEPYQRELFPIYVEDFNKFRRVLEDNVTTIYGIEESLYSDEYKVAGRTDLIAKFNDIPSIIDFKTSKNPKKEEWIESYFLQSTMYSLMVEELTDLSISQIVILICSSDNKNIQVFTKPRDQYIPRLKEIFT